MTIIELGALGEFFGSIVVTLTLIYLAVQIRQNTFQQKREETVSIHTGQNAVLSQLMDPDVMRAYVRTADADFAESAADRSRAIIWVVQYLNHFQIVYDLHRDGTLDDDRYEVWESFAISMVASKGILEWWDREDGKRGFTPAIRDLIDRKLGDSANPPVPMNEMWSFCTTEAWRSSFDETEA